MRISKYFLGLALFALGLAFTSCDKENEAALYQPTTANVSFDTDDMGQIVTPEESITVPVRIVRANKSGALSATYTLESSTEGIFSDDCNGTVNFADGESIKYINLTASNLQKGKSYTCELKLSDATQALADTVTNSMVASTKIKIMCDYIWEDAGTCKIVDFVWEENPVEKDEIPVQHAQGTNIYRVVSPLQYLYEGREGYTSFDKSNFQFTLNDDNTISIADGIYLNWWGYKMYYDASTYGTYCFIEQEGNTYAFNFLLLNGTSLYTGGYFEMTYTKP